MPVVMIMDDPCTYVANSIHRYPTESELAFGKTRGCFEKPSNVLSPNAGLSCPDIIPTEMQSKSERDAMLNASILVHPDVQTSTRYVFGTRSVLECE